VKSAYAQVAQAALGYKFAKDVADSNVTTLKKFQDRLRAGAINEGDLQRIEAQKLESDQALDQALQALRQARVQLAFLLGVRGAVSDFDVDAHVLDFNVPPSLRDATEVGLLRTAAAHRPDLAALGYSIASSQAQVDLAKRQRFPDITLGVNYGWGGGGGWSTNGAIGPQVLTFGLSMPLPAFYQMQGEIRQAQAAVDTNALQRAKSSAQVVSDVSSAFAAYVAAKRLVERMEGPRRADGGLLASANGAFESVAAQFDRGLASVTDYLDAYRTYVATKVEYFGDLTSYWTSIYQLEQAVATNLR
jgi:outer membrane protein TolC